MWTVTQSLRKPIIVSALVVIIKYGNNLMFTGDGKIMAFTEGSLQNDACIMPFCFFFLKNTTFFNMQRRWSGKIHKATVITSEKWDLGMERFGLLQYPCTTLVIKSINNRGQPSGAAVKFVRSASRRPRFHRFTSRVWTWHRLASHAVVGVPCIK